MAKLFAAVALNGCFDFNSICRKRADVVVTASDEKYGQIEVHAVEMIVFDGALPSNDDDLWDGHQIAWVWQNPDGTFWWDTFSRTKSDAVGWANNPDRLKAVGINLVPVRITAKNRNAAVRA